jgi:PAS domain S-box-containing protein
MLHDEKNGSEYDIHRRNEKKHEALSEYLFMHPETWKILLIDDDEDEYLITRDLLNQAQGRKVRLDWASDQQEARARLRQQRYDAVLVDYDLGEVTGIEFIRAVCADDIQAPLILYTGRGSYAVDLEAMQAGAALYLTKSEVNPLLLERSIRYAIERKQNELALLERERTYRQLFDAMQDGFGLHEIICDEAGKPVDYRFLEVNPAYERLTGLRMGELIGRTVREVLPDIDDFWIEAYGEVALTGQPIHFERYSRELDKYFDVSVYRTRPGQFATVFTDITVRKQAKK